MLFVANKLFKESALSKEIVILFSAGLYEKFVAIQNF